MRISASKIKLFKACRRAYELRYIEGLIPVEKAEPLRSGTTYHEKIERINKGESNVIDGFTKEDAMVTAYTKYVAPKLNIVNAEVWYQTKMYSHDIVGIVDAICENGDLVEYKTVSAEITDEYEYFLQWDEQLLMYMWLTGKRSMWYVVCRKPSIRQKKNETEEEFFDRMVAWYDEDTESKIRLMRVNRTDDDIRKFEEELRQMVFEITHASNLYRNNGYCRVWGRPCEYSSICLSYDPNSEYIEFERKRYSDGVEEA